MAKRLPRPADTIYLNLPLSPAEARALEDAAHQCRLSVASFLRVLAVESCAHPERLASWQAVAERLKTGETTQPRPGRPKGKK